MTSTEKRPASIEQLPSVWRPLTAMRRRMDDSLGDLYRDLGIEGVSTRFSMAVMFLADGDATISSLAERCGVTHSAMSQSVAAMKKAALVTSAPGEDARSRVVTLTDAGRRIAPLLWDEWYATEAAVAELETELSTPLTTVVREIDAALDRESFAERVRRHLPRDDAAMTRR
ncbi:MarR family winged helix-turn-helix transcriptional regulator [Microbacterium sp. ASV49]|uniref:MarR family transcriptional regulator n=1 Tax=Microbacterium candidum TaxID=3041922 RepID=A0ABT7MXM0_9MICO|nr:MarR family transcriptional regulator [Microbacterium sp. ASV49]MDL9979203.1 MarR family transcriptional regulator [Microbacterium sp. ASV49]